MNERLEGVGQKVGAGGDVICFRSLIRLEKASGKI